MKLEVFLPDKRKNKSLIPSRGSTQSIVVILQIRREGCNGFPAQQISIKFIPIFCLFVLINLPRFRFGFIISFTGFCCCQKIEINRVLESLYGFEVEKVRTLNMDGEKKRIGGLLIAKPDYKKAYVTLRNPLSISSDVYPIRMIEEDKKNMAKPWKKSSILEDSEPKTPHWLDEKKYGTNRLKPESFPSSFGGGGVAAAKFPWRSMKSFSR